MTVRVQMHLDAEALRRNVEVARREAPGSKLLAVVKSNAYGHGMAFVCRHLAGHVEGFAVATVDEAVAIRRLGIVEPIWVLSDFTPKTDMPNVLDNGLSPVLHSREQFQAVRDLAAPPPEVVIKIDTGMNRLGFEPSELGELIDTLRRRPVATIRVMSHLANADDANDDFTNDQCNRFNEATADLGVERSLANSAGVLAWSDTHADWVRPGIMLYGSSPILGRTGPEMGLLPVMTLSTRVLAVRSFRRGQAVGYGGTWRCPRDTRAAILACGYGDGYPRHAASGTPVLIAGRWAPLIGRVSMDSMAVDVSDLGEVAIGDRAVLWGDGLPVDVVAAHCGTIAYELFCHLAPRPAARGA